MSDAGESIYNPLELIQYDEIHTITLSFVPGKTATNPESLGIPSLHFDQIKKKTQILFKLGEGEDISKYCELTPEKYHN